MPPPRCRSPRIGSRHSLPCTGPASLRPHPLECCARLRPMETTTVAPADILARFLALAGGAARNFGAQVGYGMRKIYECCRAACDGK